MGEVEKLLIMMAFDWYEEERKHTKSVNNEIAAELFLSSDKIKAIVNNLKGKKDGKQKSKQSNCSRLIGVDN